MGKGTTSWDAIRTPEDQRRLAFFRDLYEGYRANPHVEVPKVMHWIWLGPKPVPEASLAHIQKWIDLHPDWEFKLWTDQKRKLIPSQLQICEFDAFPLNALSECYFNSDNVGEKSEILRLAILLSEGGVYIDHDMLLLKPIDPLMKSGDLLCGLEVLGDTILSSSVYSGTNLIASIPHHPVIEAAIAWLLLNWERLEAQFPGIDEMSVVNRVKHRGKKALDEGLLSKAKNSGAVVLPSAFFNEAFPEKALFAVHGHAQSWHHKEQEQKIRSFFAAIEDKFASSLLIAVGFGLFNFALSACLVKAIKSKRTA